MQEFIVEWHHEKITAHTTDSRFSQYNTYGDEYEWIKRRYHKTDDNQPFAWNNCWWMKVEAKCAYEAILKAHDIMEEYWRRANEL